MDNSGSLHQFQFSLLDLNVPTEICDLCYKENTTSRMKPPVTKNWNNPLMMENWGEIKIKVETWSKSCSSASLYSTSPAAADILNQFLRKPPWSDSGFTVEAGASDPLVFFSESLTLWIVCAHRAAFLVWRTLQFCREKPTCRVRWL